MAFGVAAAVTFWGNLAIGAMQSTVVRAAAAVTFWSSLAVSALQLMVLHVAAAVTFWRSLGSGGVSMWQPVSHLGSVSALVLCR